ncbi:MAG: hypothetical protein JNK02_17905 [Planctomycetes bacterium]|nr:hypothetical protein [Planctomycetota bacterium]
MKLQSSLSLLALAAASPLASAQYILGVESTTDTVILFSAFDGSVVTPGYINLAVASASTPIEAIVVGNEIWVSDQVADKLMRFTLDGTTHLGDVVGGMDNIRGLELVGNEVWVSNSGTAGGAPNDAVIRFSTAGVNLGFFAAGDPFDVVNFQGDVLVANILGDDLDRHDLTGAFLGAFHNSDGVSGIDFPEQVTVRANGNVLAAGFSAPIGIFEYDPTGAQINYWPVGNGNRGVLELGNGNILFSDGQGFKVLDPGTGIATTVLANTGGRFLTRFAGAGPAPIVTYCYGDGSGTACPCANDSVPGNNEGCLNSLGSGGKLLASGTPSITSDTVVLSGSGMPNSSALYFQGTTQLNGGLGSVFGDGLRCAGGSIIRLGTKANAGGASLYPGGGDPSVSVRGLISAPGVRTYQVWYRNAAAFCAPETFNLTNGVEITWGA